MTSPTSESPPASVSDRTATRVYLHGFLGAPELWQPLADALGGPLHLDYLPGHGPRPWILPDADFFAVVDALAERLPVGRWALHGYSLGARLALALALRHPRRVASLVLVGVDSGIADPEAQALRIAWEDGLAASVLASGLPAFVDAWESLPLFDSQRHLPAERLAQQRASRLGHDAAGIAWALRTLGTGRMPDLAPLLPSLSAPTLILTGALDEKFTTIDRRLAASSPRIEHRIIADAGHNPILEAPATVLALLQQFSNAHHGDSTT